MIEVGIAELKARLSEYLRRVRAGSSVLVLDREQPIASIVPVGEVEGLRVRRATRKPSEVPKPRRAVPKVDSLAALLEDRAAR